MSEMLIGFIANADTAVPFQFKITTDDESYQLPLQQYLYDGSTPAVYDFYVDWGDGEPIDHITAWNQAESQHSYFGLTGEYTISITGALSAFGHVYGGVNVGDLLMVTGFVAWGNQTTHDPDAFIEMWSDCNNLVYTATDAPDLTGVTAMWDMFWYCTSFGNAGDFSGWDVSQIEDMDSMFERCTGFNNATVTGWDVSSCEYFSEMFYDTAFDQDLSGWTPTESIDFDNFLASTPYSTANYDLLLNAWSLLTYANSGLDFNCSAEYTISTAQAARDILTDPPNNWTIIDGGGV